MSSQPVASGARPLEALLALGAGLCLIAVAGPVAGPAPTALRISLGAAISSAGFAALALAGALASPPPVAARLGLGPGRARVGWWARGLVVLGMLALSHLTDLGLEGTGWAEESRLRELDGMLLGARGGALAAAALGLALAPGLAEELLFRGFVLGALARRFGWPVGMLVSSLLFGAVHLELVHGAAASLLGLYLAAVVAATGGIRLAMLCHVANNLIAVVAGAFASAPSAAPATERALALAAVLVLAAAGAWLARTAAASR